MGELTATNIDSNQHFSLQIRALSSVRFQKIHGNRTNFKIVGIANGSSQRGNSTNLLRNTSRKRCFFNGYQFSPTIKIKGNGEKNCYYGRAFQFVWRGRRIAYDKKFNLIPEENNDAFLFALGSPSCNSRSTLWSYYYFLWRNGTVRGCCCQRCSRRCSSIRALVQFPGWICLFAWCNRAL